jgi:uncharacterized protein YecE (DUF72 family)
MTWICRIVILQYISNMDFGKVTNEELESVDFKLAADHPDTTRILSSTGKKTSPHIYVGCAKWGRKDWVGKIYPKGTKDANFLNEYAKRFNCIELNATFYRMPTPEQTSGWKSKVGSDFMFCPKFTDQITHIRRLKDTQELVDRFLTGISGFKDSLGPIFLMPHPGMGPKTADTIENFIKSLPDDVDLFVELRHKEWFENKEAFDKIFSILEQNKAGSIITDSSGRRDCVHMRLTTPEAFIRFVGNGLHPTDYTRIDAWVQRIKQWMDQGIEKVYFFMHQHEELYSPELCRYLIRELNKHCNTAIPEPEFVVNQLTADEEIEPVQKKKTTRAPRKK